MPWKECSVMDERLRFVAKLLDGESMTEVCLEFGISRKTGYKIFSRYKESGFEALSDPELRYPLHDREVLVTACGRICMHRKRISLSHVLAGQRLGIKEVDEGIWIVSFMH
jgi:transposase-like protein